MYAICIQFGWMLFSWAMSRNWKSFDMFNLLVSKLALPIANTGQTEAKTEEHKKTSTKSIQFNVYCIDRSHYWGKKMENINFIWVDPIKPMDSENEISKQTQIFRCYTLEVNERERERVKLLFAAHFWYVCYIVVNDAHFHCPSKQFSITFDKI